MAISTWSDVVLCIDADLQRLETDVLQWTADVGSVDKWRSEAKDQIGTRLDLKLRDIDIATDAAEPKDLIANYSVMKHAAIFLTLHLLANDVSHGAEDLYDRKAVMYLEKYEAELQRALQLINVDVDESGTIEAAEKYNMPTGITLKHGG